MPTYEVTVTAYKTVIVEGAEDESHATETAFDDLSFGDLEKDTAQVDKEVTDPAEIEQHRRHGTKFMKAYD